MHQDFERLAREAAPRALGVVARKFRDFAAAEDAIQDALTEAFRRWPEQGIPDNPAAWLVRVAMRRMVDTVRQEAARREREGVAALSMGYAISGSEIAEGDDTLTLMLLCCHPALTPASSIALTLRAVGGLTTPEIARAFLVPEATMGQRISRAKQTIAKAGARFEMPDPAERPARVRALRHVLYLIFNEGYAATSGEELARDGLAEEAIRLARALLEVDRDPETLGLLALFLLTHARRRARTGARGEVVPLDRQDRTLWDREAIAEGARLLEEALPRGMAGPYQLQAAIGALHNEAPDAGSTDWPQIAALYTVLLRMTPARVVRLNHAVAVAMVHGPAAGLELVERLSGEGSLENYHRLRAVRGHLLEMAGEKERAAAEYVAAAAATASLPERNYLLEQAARMRAGLHSAADPLF